MLWRVSLHRLGAKIKIVAIIEYDDVKVVLKLNRVIRVKVRERKKELYIDAARDTGHVMSCHN